MKNFYIKNNISSKVNIYRYLLTYKMKVIFYIYEGFIWE